MLVQPIGLDDSNRSHWPDMERFLASHFFDAWAEELLRKRPEIDKDMLDRFARRMLGGEFVSSVSREDVRSCATPLLVLPGTDAVHPRSVGLDIAQLAKNSEIMDPWKEPAELRPKVIERVQRFLRAHTPK